MEYSSQDTIKQALGPRKMFGYCHFYILSSRARHEGATLRAKCVDDEDDVSTDRTFYVYIRSMQGAKTIGCVSMPATVAAEFLVLFKYGVIDKFGHVFLFLFL